MRSDPQTHVDADQGALVELMRHCAQPDQHPFQHRLHHSLLFVRHHVVTLLVGGLLLLVAVALSGTP